MRREIVKELVTKLDWMKPRNESIDIMKSFIEDILQYLDNEEEEKEYKKNQYLIRMKELSRWYVVAM